MLGGNIGQHRATDPYKLIKNPVRRSLAPCATLILVTSALQSHRTPASNEAVPSPESQRGPVPSAPNECSNQTRRSRTTPKQIAAKSIADGDGVSHLGRWGHARLVGERAQRGGSAEYEVQTDGKRWIRAAEVGHVWRLVKVVPKTKALIESRGAVSGKQLLTSSGRQWLPCTSLVHV